MAKTVKIKPQLTFFDDESARNAANEIEAIEDGSNVHVVLKSYGGGLWDGWESCFALQKFKGHSTVDTPGVSASFGIAFMSFADKRICSSQAKFMIHAVAGGTEKVNKESKKELYDILAKVINLDKFKEVTGKTLKDVMIPLNGERVDIWLNAKEAKKVELIHEIYNLDPNERAAAENELLGYYQFVEYKEPVNNGVITPIINTKISKMNKEQLKAEHPALYNEIYNAGVEAGKPLGVTAEQGRVNAFMAFHEIDAKLVIAKINDGSPMDAAFHLEIAKTSKANALATTADDDSEKPLDAGTPANEPKKGAKKTDLSVIPEDVKAQAISRMQDLDMSEIEINAELVVLANDYAPKTTK